jgi:hypothetical protein
MKEEFNKDIEILNKSNWNLRNEKLNNPNKNSIENLANRMGQVENRISKNEDEVEKLNQSEKQKEKY